MNQVLHWNAVALEASRRDHSQGYANGQQSGPTATSRALAIVHLAIHDAIAYVQKPGAAYLYKRKGITLAAPSGAHIADVIEGAAVYTLTALYPKYAEYFQDSLSNGTGASFAFGEAVGAKFVLERKMDGAEIVPAPAVANEMYGAHQLDPFQTGQGLLGVNWGDVHHFVGPRVELDDFPGRGHANYLDDMRYRKDFEEVRELGAGERRSRTAEQTVIGVYWAYDGVQGIGVPPRLYNQIARKIASTQSLDLAQTAELFAEINVAMADAGIDAWHHKYVQNLWRPVVGVRAEKAPDGDPFWAPLGAPQTNRPGVYWRTPPFPAYPSGHATFGAALFQVLRLRLGGSPITVADVLAAENGCATIADECFEFVSDELDGRAVDPDGSVRTKLVREFPSFARAVWENAISRVFLGVHWRFDGLPRHPDDCVGGVPLGLRIGQQVHECFATGDSLGSS